jgi:hypothetical protein
MKHKKPIIAAAVAAGVLAAGVGTAVAVWTVTGTGSGSGGAAIASGLTVTAFTPTGAAANIYPGGPAGSVNFQVANPNPFAVTITAIQWGTPVSTNPSSCPTSNISLDANAPTSVNISVPANATPGTVYVVPGVLDLAHSAPNGCQGVSFNIQMTVTGAQQ